MVVSDEVYLDYSDVLIRPNFSTLESRNDVNLKTTLNGKINKIGGIVPIVSSNMDTVSTFEAANVLAKNNMLCALHKHYSLEEYVEYFKKTTLTIYFLL